MSKTNMKVSIFSIILSVILIAGLIFVVFNSRLTPDNDNNITNGKEISQRIDVRIDDYASSVVMPVYIDRECTELVFYALTQSRHKYGNFYKYYVSYDGEIFVEGGYFANDVSAFYVKDGQTVYKLERKKTILGNYYSFDKIFFDLLKNYETNQFDLTPAEIKFIDLASYLECYRYQNGYWEKVSRIPYMNMWVARIVFDKGELYYNPNPQIWYNDYRNLEVGGNNE